MKTTSPVANTTAWDVLNKALEDMTALCDVMLDKFNGAVARADYETVQCEDEARLMS